VEKAYSSKHPTLAGKLRTTTCEVIPATNDRWLNGHSKTALLHWGGNCDFTLLLDYDQTINYVAKYGTKKEKNSQGYERIFQTALNKTRSNEGDTRSVLRSIFLRSNAGREKTQQETSHLALSLAMVRCSHQFITINLYNNYRKVNLRNQINDNIIDQSLIDFYSKRMDPQSWAESIRDDDHNAERLSLLEFSRKYRVTKLGGQQFITTQQKETVASFIPDFPSSPASKLYTSYCYFSLIKYKPWVDFPESTYGGRNGKFEDEIEIYSNSNHNDPITNPIISAWYQFLREYNAENPPDYIQRRIDEMRSFAEQDQWTPLHEETDGLELDENISQDNFTRLCREALLSSQGDLSSQQCEWNDLHTWTTPEQLYVQLPTSDWIKRKWDEIQQGIALVEHRQINRESLNQLQGSAFDLLSYMVENKDNFATLHPEISVKGLLLTGGAGCGKSYVVDAIRTRYGERVKVMAFSGKAGSNINGSTIHSALGINPKSRDPLHVSAQKTLQLQSEFRDVDVLIIDEYTMISLDLFHLIDLRCRLAKAKSDFVFGGMVIVLVGDPGQLPPVSGKVLWYDRNDGLSPSERLAQLLYRDIPFTILLQGSNRLVENEFKALLEEFFRLLRTGDVTREIYERICHLTSQQYHITRLGSIEEYNNLFLGYNSTFYANTNVEVLRHNLLMLKSTNKPICKIASKHVGEGAIRGTDDETMRLPPMMYISVNSKVLLLWNLSISHKLVNGSNGIVKDILFEGDKPPPNHLPYCIVVEFPDYSGPRVFDDVVDLDGNVIENRSKWVPILPQTVRYGRSNSTEGTNERTAFPLSLAWAWTPWKGQGTTNHGPCLMDPGDKETQAGLCYVMLTRITSILNLCIPKGMTFERITAKIKKAKGLISRINEENRITSLAEITLDFLNTYVPRQ
jgi:DNA replication protein DnaC